MKHIDTDGITFIEPISGATGEWYYGIGYEHGDLYEAEELFKIGEQVKGRSLVLVHYPDGTVYKPVPKEEPKEEEPPKAEEPKVEDPPVAEEDFQDEMFSEEDFQ